MFGVRINSEKHFVMFKICQLTLTLHLSAVQLAANEGSQPPGQKLSFPSICIIIIRFYPKGEMCVSVFAVEMYPFVRGGVYVQMCEFTFIIITAITITTSNPPTGA